MSKVRPIAVAAVAVAVAAIVSIGGAAAFSQSGSTSLTAAVSSPTYDFVAHDITTAPYDQVERANNAGDLNGDGKPDLVIAGEKWLVWYENPGNPAANPVWPAHKISSGIFGIASLVALRDLDGDGRLDIIVGKTVSGTRGMYWYENKASGWTQHTLSSDHNCHHLSFGDLNKDGLVDMACAGGSDARIFWMERPANVLTANKWAGPWDVDARSAWGMRVADMDGDGNLDFVTGRAWYRNQGLTSASTSTAKKTWTRVPYTLAEDTAPRSGWNPAYFNDIEENSVLDVNGDGRLDIVSALFSGSPEGRASVFLAPANPLTGTWTEVPLNAGPLFSVHTMVSANYDQSGRPQIVIGEMAWGGYGFGHNPGPTTMVIYRLEGAASDPAAWKPYTIASDDIGTHAAAVIDINGDGRTDLISGEENSGPNNPVQNGRPRWWENRTVPGPPISSSKPILSGIYRAGEQVSSTDGTWQGASSFARQWFSCAADGTSDCHTIPGATTNNLALDGTQEGRTVYFQVTASNDVGPTVAQSDPSAVIQAAFTSPPTNTARPTISGTFRADRTISGIDGTWQNATSFTRQWFSCAANGTSDCHAIGGATTSSLVLTSADVGRTVRFDVTATNSVGPNTESSDPSPVIDGQINRAPDPSFESAKPTVYYKTGGNGTIKIVSTVAHTGLQSWYLKGNGTGIKKIYSKYQNITAQPGATYSATGWVKTTAMASASVINFEIWFYDKTGKLISGHTPAGVLSGVHDWTMLSTTGVSPDKTAFVAIAMELEKGTGTLYYDDVTLTGPGAAPNPVTNFTANAKDGSVDLSWTKPATFDSIQIVRKQGTSDPTSPDDGVRVYTGTGASFSDTTVTNGVTYRYGAWSDAGGTLSSAQFATATPAVPPVTNFHAVAGDNRVSLSWANPSTQYDTVDIRRTEGTDSTGPTDGLLVFTGTTDVSFVDTTVTNGTNYHYAAYVKHGTSFSAAARVNSTPAVPPVPPVTNLTAGVADGRVDLSWTNPTESFDVIRVVRKQDTDPADPSDGTLVCACTGTTTSDADVTNGNSYHYGVWVDRGGIFSVATRVNATPTAAVTYTSTPSGGYGKTAAGWTVGAVFHVTVDTVLSRVGKVFQAGSTASNSLGLWDELNPSTPLFIATVTPSSPTVDVPLILLQANKHYVLGIKEASGTPWSGAHALTGLPSFLVIDDSAFLKSSSFGYPNGRDNQPGFSNEDWTMTLTPGGSTSGGTVNPVTNFQAVPGDTRVDLSWVNPAGSFDTVKILRQIGADPVDETDGTVVYNGTGTSVSDTAVVNNTEYHYAAWVKRDTSISSVKRATATPVLGAVPSVSNLQATTGDRAIDLTWANPTGQFDKIQIARKVGSNPSGPNDGLIYEGTDQALHQSNLTNGSDYFYGVWVVRGSDLSSPVFIDAIPAVPPVTNLQATAGDTQIALSWQPPAPYDSVIVRRSTTAYPPGPTDGTAVFDATGTGTTDTGLANNQAVYYSVFARHGTAGQAESYSAAAHVTATPVDAPVAAVTNLVGTGFDNGDVNLTWTNPTSGPPFTSIVVRRAAGADPAGPTDGTSICGCTPTDTSVGDSGRQTGISYHYAVWVERSGLFSAATRVNVVPPVPPVQSFNASPASGKVTLSWSDPSGPYDTIKIRRKDGLDPSGPNDGTATLIVPDGNSYQDVGLTNTHTYHYGVWAIHNNVASSAARMNATPGTTGTAVTNLQAAAKDERVDLSWTNPGDGVTAIHVVRKEGSAPANPSDGTEIYSGTDQQKADIGRTNGHTYFYGVWVDRSGDFSPVAIASATPAIPPVTNLQGLAGDKTVDLTWQNPSTSFNSIRILRKAGSDPSSPTDGTQIFNGLSEMFTDSGPLTNGVDYHYAAWVVRSGSPDSAASRVTATPVDAPVPPVTNLVATPSSKRIDLSWTNPASGFDTVRVVRKQGSAPTDPDDGTVLFSGGVATSAADTNLQSGLTYHYAVWTIRSTTLYSSPVRTSASPPVPPITNLQGSPGDGQVSLNWTVPSEPYDTIKIVRKAGSDPIDPSDGSLIYNDAGNAALDIGLTNGVDYHYAVWVVRVGVLSTPTRITVTPATSANAGVANLQAASSDSRIDLSWTNPPGSYDSVKVTWQIGADPSGPSDGTPACTCTGGESTLAISGLTNGTLYHIGVWVDRSGVLSAPARVNATPAPAPVDPVTNLQATAGDGEAHLTWQNPVSAFDSIKVTRKAGTDPTDQNDGTVVFSGVGTFVDDFGLVDNTSYHYAVWVLKGAGVSAPARANSTPAVTGDPDAPVTYPVTPVGAYGETSNFNKVYGAEFHVSTDKFLSHLGKSFQDGSTAANTIAIWDQNTQTLLRQVTVSPSAPTAAVSPALLLQAGIHYVIGIKEAAGSPFSAGVGRTLTNVPSFLTIDDTAYKTGVSTLTYPDGRNGSPGITNEDWIMRFVSQVSPVTGLAATPGNARVDLAWTNPSSFDSIMVRREEGSNPGPTTGTLICDPCAGASVADTSVTNDHTYTYGVWARKNGTLSAPAFASTTPSTSAGPTTYASTPLGGWDKSAGSRTVGFSFHVTTNKTLTEVGKVYKAGSPAGGNGQIAIWDTANPDTNASLFSAAIEKDAPVVAVPNLLLQAGHTYVLGIKEVGGTPWSSAHGPLTGLPSFLVIDAPAISSGSGFNYPGQFDNLPGSANEDWTMTFAP